MMVIVKVLKKWSGTDLYNLYSQMDEAITIECLEQKIKKKTKTKLSVCKRRREICLQTCQVQWQ